MSKWKQICTKWSKLITNITNANTEKWSIAVELHHGKCRTVVRIICSSSNAMDKKSGHFLQVFYRRAILNIWNKMCPTLLIFTVLYVCMSTQLCGPARVFGHDGNTVSWSTRRRPWCANHPSHQDCLRTLRVSAGHVATGIVCTVKWHQHAHTPTDTHI